MSADPRGAGADLGAGVHEPERWTHDHSAYVPPRAGRAERNTLRVVFLTLVTMVVELVAGFVTGSMALLADGWHMASHAAALGVAVWAYSWARRHAGDPRWSFGTGKAGALAGFGSAVGLGIGAILMVEESISRFFEPVTIRFDEAIAVATLGLVVNLVSAWMLHGSALPGIGHAHDHRHDHNLRAALGHVLADALTSALAIIALLCGRAFGWGFLDPAMGIVGGVVVVRWAIDLLRSSGRVLLDHEERPEAARRIRERFEGESGVQVVDLHLWSIAPGQYAVIASLVAHEPLEPDHYKERLAGLDGLAHVTVEVNRCCD